MSDHELPDPRPADTPITHLAAEAENITRDMAAASERRAADARAVGHEATASVHDMFAQAEHTAGEQARDAILERGDEPPKPPEPTY